MTSREESHLGMAAAQAQRWCLQGRRERISSPQRGGGAVWSVMAAGMGWVWWGLAGPFPFLQSLGVCRGKNEHPSLGHHFIYCTAGKLRQHMNDCDSGGTVLEAQGDMCVTLKSPVASRSHSRWVLSWARSWGHFVHPWLHCCLAVGPGQLLHPPAPSPPWKTSERWEKGKSILPSLRSTLEIS